MHYAFGFTGNGVGPSHLAGRTLAALALGRRDPVTELPLVDSDAGAWVPPEPLAWLGGSLVRRGARPPRGRDERGERARPAHARDLRGAAGARDPRGALSSPR